MPPFQLSRVARVEFYRRDPSIADQICCDIFLPTETIFAHDDMPHWDELIRKLEFLGGFDVEWFSQLSKPADGASRYIAFER
ncbi:hypothetical protein GRI44_01175 [Altererythrobacter confluentis]|uniref:Uncharacterized protein n=1 Tax=Allopontixanthobacter confluentis TaxID=1849021 RepID=A0A6L7GCY0_9SPHN|nr:hypothetical protein [Allopontixanthobacter confluentis]MXP13365.1 hypothetical protein [Allopontixanthobacter confluentis]